MSPEFYNFLKLKKRWKFDDFKEVKYKYFGSLIDWYILKPITTYPDPADHRIKERCDSCGGSNIIVSTWSYDHTIGNDSNPWESKWFDDHHKIFCSKCFLDINQSLKHKT